MQNMMNIPCCSTKNSFFLTSLFTISICCAIFIYCLKPHLQQNVQPQNHKAIATANRAILHSTNAELHNSSGSAGKYESHAHEYQTNDNNGSRLDIGTNFNFLSPVSCRDLPSFKEYLTLLPRAALTHFDAWSTHAKLALQNGVRNGGRNGKTNDRFYPSIAEVEEMVNLLTPYIICTPEPAVVTEKPPPRNDKLTFENIDCAAIRDPTTKQPVFVGKRAKPAFLIDMSTLGYELDVLEIKLHELYAVVDHFIVFESMYGHRLIHKPLYFELAKHAPRFRPFLEKIVHIVMDEHAFYAVHAAEKAADDDAFAHKTFHNDWRGEHIMRTYPWQQYLQAIAAVDGAGKGSSAQLARVLNNSNVLLLTGDMDEIPNAESLWYLKHCELDPHVYPLPVVYDQMYPYMFSFDYVNNVGVCSSIFDASKYNGAQFRTGFKKRTKLKNKRLFFYWHLKRIVNNFALALKQLLIAEAGHLSERALQYFDDPYQWFNNEKNGNPAANFRKTGYRTRAKAGGGGGRGGSNGVPIPIPWFPVCNKQRFPWMFNQHCKQTNPEKYPLRYACNESQSCVY